jgi:hypothetical protein
MHRPCVWANDSSSRERAGAARCGCLLYDADVGALAVATDL